MRRTKKPAPKSKWAAFAGSDATFKFDALSDDQREEFFKCTQGTIDLRGTVVFSFDPYSDDHAKKLEVIGAAVFSLRRIAPEDSIVGEFAKIVAEDYAPTPRSLVPASLTQGHEVWYEELFFQRSRLPAGFLLSRLLPLIAEANASPGIIVAPINCWADELVNDWTSRAAKRPPTVDDFASPVPLKDFLADPLVIMPAAARELQRVGAQQRLTEFLPAEGECLQSHGEILAAIPNPKTFLGPDPALRMPNPMAYLREIKA